MKSGLISKAAFANPDNLSLLVGGLAASALTLNPLLAVITVGLEILWVVNAPGSKKLQELLWDPNFDEQQQAQEQAARAARLQSLDETDRERVLSLFARQQEINALAAQNPSFTGELLPPNSQDGSPCRRSEWRDVRAL